MLVFRANLHHDSEFHAGFREYSRHVLFQRGARREQRFQAMVDRRRASLGIERIKTLLGYQRRPTFHPKDSAARRWQVVVEKPTYDRPVFKVLA